MENPEAVLARLVRDQLGIVTRSQALGAGVSRHAIDRRLSDARLRELHAGAYLHAAWPLTPEGRILAAVLAAGGAAVASHRSAARLHGLRGVPRCRPEITTPTLDLPLLRDVVVHRTTLLAEQDRTVVAEVPCTTVARTLLDLGAVVPYEVVELAVQDAVIRRLVTHWQLLAVLERVGGRGRRGTAPLRAVVREALPDERLESELERRLAALLPPGFTLQHELRCLDGRLVRLDAALPARKVAVEANGHRWHGTSRDLRRDMERRRAIAATGWTVHEYGWADVTERPAVVRAELAALAA